MKNSTVNCLLCSANKKFLKLFVKIRSAACAKLFNNSRRIEFGSPASSSITGSLLKKLHQSYLVIYDLVKMPCNRPICGRQILLKLLFYFLFTFTLKIRIIQNRPLKAHMPRVKSTLLIKTFV